MAVLLFLIIFSNVISYSKSDSVVYNPFFRDSILKNKLDTVRWNNFVNTISNKKKAVKTNSIQQIRPASSSFFYLYVAAFIILILIILKVIFEDFSNSLLEGLISMKQFMVFYKSKKYDSLIAVLLVYAFNILLLSLLVFVAWSFYYVGSVKQFHFSVFLDICLLMAVFFTAKYGLEYIFNFIIETLDTFKAFFLLSLFSEFTLSIILLVLSLIYIYNDYFQFNQALGIFSLIIVIYVFFNIARSYQLISIARLPYKLHFFLYVCGFKLIPILLLIKFFFNNIGLKLQ